MVRSNQKNVERRIYQRQRWYRLHENERRAQQHAPGPPGEGLTRAVCACAMRPAASACAVAVADSEVGLACWSLQKLSHTWIDTHISLLHILPAPTKLSIKPRETCDIVEGTALALILRS